MEDAETVWNSNASKMMLRKPNYIKLNQNKKKSKLKNSKMLNLNG